MLRQLVWGIFDILVIVSIWRDFSIFSETTLQIYENKNLIIQEKSSLYSLIVLFIPFLHILYLPFFRKQLEAHKQTIFISTIIISLGLMFVGSRIGDNYLSEQFIRSGYSLCGYQKIQRSIFFAWVKGSNCDSKALHKEMKESAYRWHPIANGSSGTRKRQTHKLN